MCTPLPPRNNVLILSQTTWALWGKFIYFCNSWECVISPATTIFWIQLCFRNSLRISCILFSYRTQHIFVQWCKCTIYQLFNSISRTYKTSSETLRKLPVPWNHKAKSNWFWIDIDEASSIAAFGFGSESWYSPSLFTCSNPITYSFYSRNVSKKSPQYNIKGFFFRISYQFENSLKIWHFLGKSWF